MMNTPIVNEGKLSYPKSVGFIVSNEFCERFSYYGMRTILSFYLRDKLGYSDDGATVIYHTFTMFAYFFPVLGAVIADGLLGRYRTILYLSIVYALGSTLISLTAMPPLNIPMLAFTIIALLLIAFGTGGIKPCVSAFGGDQFKLPEQERALGYFFSVYYFAINAGSLISTFVTPILRKDISCFGDNDCYSLAFGVPAILMILSIVLFVSGKRWYVMKNPTNNVIGDVTKCIGHGMVKSCKSKEKREHWLDHADDKYDRELIEDIKSTFRVLVLFVPLPIFWALFDQQGSRWTFQADRMKQDIGSWTLKADQMQVLNPLLILAFIPIFEVAIYPFLTWCRLIRKPLHKMIWGGFLAAIAFVVSGLIELKLVPTYGNPVTYELAQLRVYNGFDCNFDLSMPTLPVENQNVIINSLTMYEEINIKTTDYAEFQYKLDGASNGTCSNISHTGSFLLYERTANSFFINNEGVNAFIDNNDKAIDTVHVRFLSNLRRVVNIELINTRNNMQEISVSSSNTTQFDVGKGTHKLTVDGKTDILEVQFDVGGVYTIIIYENDNGEYMANVETVTPPNSVHILWLIPQYVIMTMGEVMFSVTGLEFSFTQAPVTMKSVLTSAWLLTVAFGNLIVILIVEIRIFEDQWKEFFLFAGLMVVDMLIFMIMAFRYKYVETKSSTENIPEISATPSKTTEEKNK